MEGFSISDILILLSCDGVTKCQEWVNSNLPNVYLFTNYTNSTICTTLSKVLKDHPHPGPHGIPIQRKSVNGAFARPLRCNEPVRSNKSESRRFQLHQCSEGDFKKAQRHNQTIIDGLRRRRGSETTTAPKETPTCRAHFHSKLETHYMIRERTRCFWSTIAVATDWRSLPLIRTRLGGVPNWRRSKKNMRRNKTRSGKIGARYSCLLLLYGCREAAAATVTAPALALARSSITMPGQTNNRTELPPSEPNRLGLLQEVKCSFRCRSLCIFDRSDGRSIWRNRQSSSSCLAFSNFGLEMLWMQSTSHGYGARALEESEYLNPSIKFGPFEIPITYRERMWFRFNDCDWKSSFSNIKLAGKSFVASLHTVHRLTGDWATFPRLSFFKTPGPRMLFPFAPF